MDTQYTILPQYYDALNDGADYIGYADFISKRLKDNSKILDLACGTGNMSILLSKAGHRLTCLDISQDMLSVARKKSDDEKLDIFFVCQNMTNFSFTERFDAIICCFDSVNYILDKKLLDRCFSIVCEHLSVGGKFIFDINSEYKFSNIYAQNSYILENDGVFCAWENYYNPKSRMCDFYLNVFAREQNGLWSRHCEEQRERMYTERQIKQALSKAGLAITETLSFEEPAERIYYVCEKKETL